MIRRRDARRAAGTASPASSGKPARWPSSPTAASSASSSSATATPRSSSWSTSRGSSSGGSGRRSNSRSAPASLAEICDAVHHAHGLGIQHRDLKPSNIMVDAALLAADSRLRPERRRSAQGTLEGTVRYIAPEQLDPVAADRRAHRRLRARRDPLRAAVRHGRRTPARPTEGSWTRSAPGSPGCRSRSIRGCPSRCRRSRSRPWSGARSRYQTAQDMAPTCSGSSPAVRSWRARRSTRRRSAAAPRRTSSTSPSGCSSG